METKFHSCNHHEYSINTYPDQFHCSSRTNASKFDLLESSRGPFESCNPFYLPLTQAFKPGDWVKQSTPFSYLSLTAVSLDNSTHQFEVYSHISPSSCRYSGSPIPTNVAAGSVTLDGSRSMVPKVTTNTDIIYYSITYWEPISFSEEFGTDAGWGTLYYAMKTVSNNNFLHCVAHSSLSRRATSHTRLTYGLTPFQPSSLMGP